MHPTISGYLIQARQVDAARAGQRDRVLLEARRIRRAGHRHARGPGAGLVRTLARLMAVSRMRIAALRVRVATRINGR